MRAALGCLCLVLVSWAAMGQVKPVPPAMRYNVVSEMTFLLERCGELTSERRAWLDNVRGHAARAMQWDEAKLAMHDAELAAEFRIRYPSVEKVRCEELARNIDHERAVTIKVPLSLAPPSRA
ncbi:MAG TPA: hypothetical protein VFC18_01205 [Burkholderiales bacterium]|nr:hypothetical protein [Burkholderiales bacterium]